MRRINIKNKSENLTILEKTIKRFQKDKDEINTKNPYIFAGKMYSKRNSKFKAKHGKYNKSNNSGLNNGK